MEQIAISHSCELAHHPACNQIPMDESGFFTQCLIGARALCCPKGFKKEMLHFVGLMDNAAMVTQNMLQNQNAILITSKNGLVISPISATNAFSTKCGVSWNVFPQTRGAGLERVIGGRESHSGDWPWLGSLYVKYQNGTVKFICTGSILSPRFVLTAAHCVKNEAKLYPKHTSQLFLRVGSEDRTKGGTIVNVSIPYVHPGYSISNQHDIALLQLQSDLVFNTKIAPVCIAKEYKEEPYDYGFIVGWGWSLDDTNNISYSPVVHENTVPFQPIELCKQYFDKPTYSEVDPAIQICAGALMHGTAQGDSGGPLLINKKGSWNLVGITSFGEYIINGPPDDAKVFDVGVYTRIAPHCPWILKITNGTVECS
uniref:Peptidase S1 domain-containing protein n=1 Tax=Acrobeloides nanus TaxID=290746 RepID=A0A914E8C3_9BILA